MEDKPWMSHQDDTQRLMDQFYSRVNDNIQMSNDSSDEEEFTTENIMSQLRKNLDTMEPSNQKSTVLQKHFDMTPEELNASSSEDEDAQVQAREIIRAYMQVENESTLIKDKHSTKKDWKFSQGNPSTEGLYDLSKWDRIERKVEEPENFKINELHKPRDEEFDEDEDQKIAFELLHRFKKDKGFIKKDLEGLKFLNKKEIINPKIEEAKRIANKKDDFVARMEHRQKEIKDKRGQRRIEEMRRKEEEKKRREEENRKIKANLDLEGVMIDSPKTKKAKKKPLKTTPVQITGNKRPEMTSNSSENPNSEADKIISEVQLGCDDRLNMLRQKKKD